MQTTYFVYNSDPLYNNLYVCLSSHLVTSLKITSLCLQYSDDNFNVYVLAAKNHFCTVCIYNAYFLDVEILLLCFTSGRGVDE